MTNTDYLTKPQFYITQNLMGYGSGLPDRNKRFIHRYPSRSAHDEEIVICHPSDPEKGWTNKDERALQAYLSALNEDE